MFSTRTLLGTSAFTLAVAGALLAGSASRAHAQKPCSGYKSDCGKTNSCEYDLNPFEKTCTTTYYYYPAAME